MKKSVKNILISGYYGFDNAGDELVLGEIIKALRREGDQFKITVLSAQPQATADKFGVMARDRWKPGEILSSLLRTDLLISGGGSLLQDKTSKNGILYYLMIIFLGLLLRKEILILSQGIGPVDHKRNRRIMSFLLNRLTWIYVRDQDSLIYLEKMGVRQEIKVSADPVFLLEKASREERDQLWKKLDLDSKKKLIAVSLRDWTNKEKFLQASKDFLLSFDRDIYQVRYLAFHKGEDDLLLEGMVNKDEIVSQDLQPEELAWLIGQANFVLGMRLHSLILAGAQEVPFVSISYDPKVDALDRTIYPDSFVINTANVSKDKLEEKYNYVIDFKYSNEELKERALRPFKEAL